MNNTRLETLEIAKYTDGQRSEIYATKQSAILNVHIYDGCNDALAEIHLENEEVVELRDWLNEYIEGVNA